MRAQVWHKYCFRSATVALSYFWVAAGVATLIAPHILDLLNLPEVQAQLNQWLPSGWFTTTVGILTFIARMRTLVKWAQHDMAKELNQELDDDADDYHGDH